ASAGRRAGPPVAAGTGVVVGTSADGSAAYVEEIDPAVSRSGCEGRPEPVMFRLPLTGGPKELLGTPRSPLRGLVVRGGGGRAAVVDACEGFLSALRVGNEAPDGRLSDLKVVDLPGGASRPLPAGVGWSVDGTVLLLASGSSVVRLDPATGASSKVFDVTGGRGVLSQVAELADGSYVVGGRRQVSLRDRKGVVRATFEGDGFTVSPDGRRLVVLAADGALSVFENGSGTPSALLGADPGATVEVAQFSPAGDAVVFVRTNGAESTLSVVPVVERRAVLVSSRGPFGRPYFSGDGRAVVFNQFETGPDRVTQVVVSRLS
ncbi:MAG: WD40 repeat domain-containing protein, partial [Acidimicrobiales bacterium]